MTKWIDLRSDTVTRPTSAMLHAMVSAEVGDDVYGEDPTVNRLEKFMAEQVGMESGLFASSGTQCNLLSLLSHCERGDEYIAGQSAHIYKWEGGGGAVLGSIQPQPIDFEKDGTLSLEKVESYIKPDDNHHPKTRLLCLENTESGKVLPLEYLKRARDFSRRHGLQLHLDGARAMNAAVKLGVDIQKITGHFDSVSICLSKGLGAPVGSVLCGDADFIKKARRWRKVLGGGMRQAGILAAAGIFALQNHVSRLAQDHENALYLAKALSELEELEVDLDGTQTNMIFGRWRQVDSRKVADVLKRKGVLIFPSPLQRWVTHLDIHAEDLKIIVGTFKEAIHEARN